MPIRSHSNRDLFVRLRRGFLALKGPGFGINIPTPNGSYLDGTPR